MWINFCNAETKLAIPKLIKKLPEGIELDEERIENLATVFPLQYLSMFEVIQKKNKKEEHLPLLAIDCQSIYILDCHLIL